MPLETDTGKGFLSGAVLKNTAYITMFIDHFFAVVYLALLNQYRIAGAATDSMEQAYRAGRAVGRIAFILFAYLAAEGFYYTRSRRDYLFRLGLFAFVSEVPFDLAFSGVCFDPGNQNVFFTLFLGILALAIWEWAADGPAALRGVQIASLVFCCAAAYFLRTDYKFMGVLLIFTFYRMRGRKLPARMVAAGCVMLFGTWSMNCIRYVGEYSVGYLFLVSLREMYGLFAFLWIGLYNGKKGIQLPKVFYYAFYPVHLFLLYCAAALVTGGGL